MNMALPDLALHVMEALQWDSTMSTVFRSICTEWRDAHDSYVTRLRVNGNCLPINISVTRTFPRVNEVVVRRQSEDSFADEHLETLAGFTSLTSLDLRWCRGFTNHGLQTLTGLTALARLNLAHCQQISDDGLRHVAGLTSLTILDLSMCRQMTDDGLRALRGLTSLTSLHLAFCDLITNHGLRTLAGFVRLNDLCLISCRQVTI
jgi:hypothetical protein